MKRKSPAMELCFLYGNIIVKVKIKGGFILNKAIAATVVSSALLLSACSGSGAEEQLDNVLKSTFDAEKEYRSTQKDMQKLEEDEQKLFEDIMSLTQEEQEKVSEQAEEALASADERLKLLASERESMAAAQENFKEIDDVIEETDEESVKAGLEELKAKMQERFDAHSTFAEAYEELNKQQQELYSMLKDDTTTLQSLQEKALAVNSQNELVQEAVTAFNEKTEQFNELKSNVISEIEKS